LIGILFLDQYKKTLVSQELLGLRRQAETLAIMMNRLEGDSERVIRRSFSKETIELLVPLAGQSNKIRIRLFQPDGSLYTDTKLLSQLSPKVKVLRLPKFNHRNNIFDGISGFINNLIKSIKTKPKYPLYQEYSSYSAKNFVEVLTALNGFNADMVRQDKNGKLILSVAVPVGNERRVRGAVLLSTDGKTIQEDISQLQYSFMKIFLFVIVLTSFLGFIFSKKITMPISRLAKAADKVRKNKNKTNMEVKTLINRKDEIGELAYSLDAMTKDLLLRMDSIASFAADVSHELKNPLTSLRSAIETLSIIKDKTKKNRLMEIVLEDINRLDRLITDISDASRLDADLSRDETTSINLSKLIEEFIEIRKEIIRNVNFKVKVQDGLIIRGNQARLIQVFDNLINNAISFSPKNGEINIEAFLKNQKILVKISDQGQGISEGKKETIFDRFYTERPSNEKFGKHSGLGLSIVRQILLSHNANIYAENKYDDRKVAGARFIIEF